MDSSTVVAIAALVLGILLWTAFDICRAKLGKRQSSGMRKAVRVLAATGIAYIMLFFGGLAFFIGHYRGAAGQSFAEALKDVFVPYRTPEILLLPGAIFWFLILLTLAVRLVLVLTRPKSRNDAEHENISTAAQG